MWIFRHGRVPGPRQPISRGREWDSRRLSAMTRDRTTAADTGTTNGSPTGSAAGRLSVAGEALKPEAILARLGIESADPARWLRRTFKKYDVPYLQVAGQVRATEEQF